MDLDLLVNGRAAIVLVDLLVLALVALVRPMYRDHGDDQGDGRTLVLLPPPKLPHLGRTAGFTLTFLALIVAYKAYHGPYSPDELYRSALRDVTDRIVAAPAVVDGFLSSFTLGLRVLVFGAMLSLALTCRAAPLRRAAIVVQCLWYVVAVFLFDCLLVVASVLTGVGGGPGTILGNWFAIAVGFLGMARLVYANFALPKPSTSPRAQNPQIQNGIVLLATTVTGMCVSLTVLTLLYERTSVVLTPILVVLAPIPFSALAYIVRSTLLAVYAYAVLKRPEVGVGRPPIDVIIPAYNEEEVIVGTLEAIDAAAARYGGPVRIILTDDGSTDRTRPLALETSDRFVAATCEIVEGGHGGKSAALNLALSHAEADIVVRIDADTIIADDAFVFLPRWFDDPTIGLVEALMWPRWEPTPYHRLRLFEELRTFGVNHRVLQAVDGVNVVPGVFVAFRRQPAVELGGFTLGMNGEDGDFTMRMARMGWRSRLDPKIRVFEGVPESFLEMREQRVRWCRATIHNQSRHGVYRACSTTPMVWFSQTFQYFRRVRSPIFFVLPLYLAVYAAFDGAWRLPIVVGISAVFIGQIAYVSVGAVLAAGYGFENRVGWLLLWPIWRIFLTMFSTESLLSLPGRPVHLLRRDRAVISEAVVH
jgi:cellulose synthase/poly-beta-1,6-N-acetylglucosamine synthase-like glycosyltransferase